MAYLDPASNPGSMPQRLGATNCKSSTSDKLQTFRTIFAISCMRFPFKTKQKVLSHVNSFWSEIYKKCQK